MWMQDFRELKDCRCLQKLPRQMNASVSRRKLEWVSGVSFGALSCINLQVLEVEAVERDAFVTVIVVAATMGKFWS